MYPHKPPDVSLRAAAVLGCLILLAIYSQFFRSSIGVIAPDIAHEIPMEADRLGRASSAFFFVFAILQIPVGIALDRYGVRRTLTLMLLVAVVGALVFAAGNSVDELIVGRFLVGFGFTGLMIGGIATLTRWFSPLQFPAAMALLFASSNAGSLLATLPLAAATDAWGWRATFVGLAVISAALTAAFHFVGHDAPKDHPFLLDRRRDSLVEVTKGLGEAVRVRDLFYLLPLIAVGYASIITVLGLWGGPFLHDVYALDAVGRGRILFAMALAMIAGTLAYGPLHRWFGARRPVIIAGAASTAAVFIALGLIKPSSLALTAFLLCLLAFVGAYSVTVMAHGVSLFPPALVGRGTAILHVALNGGTALLQAMTGEIVVAFGDHGTPNATSYGSLFLFLGGITVVALLTYIRVRDIAPAAVRNQPGE